jgi:hypothetical protein
MNYKALLVLTSIVTASAAQADLLSLYDFNLGSNSGTSAANEALLLTPNGGTLKANSVLTTTSHYSADTANAGVVSFTGTTTNAPSGIVAGAALSIQGGFGGSGTGNNGTSLTLAVNAGSKTDLTNLDLSFAMQRTSTGFNSVQLAYSINGGTYVNDGSAFTPFLSTAKGLDGNTGIASTSAIENFDLSKIGTGITSIDLRLTYTGATGDTGNIRIDNLQLNGKTQAVPEPSSIAAMGLGILALARRRRSAK